MIIKHIIARGMMVASLALLLSVGTGCKNKPADSTSANPNNATSQSNESPPDTPQTDPASVAQNNITAEAPQPKSPTKETVTAEATSSLSEQQRREIREITSKAASSDSEERQAANEILDQLSSDEKAYVKALMKDSSAEIRRGAALYLLAQVSSGEEDLFSAYIELLSDEDRQARHIALLAIRSAPKSEILRAIPGVATLLKNPREENDNRSAAARLFSSLGPDGDQALPALLEVLQSDADEKVRSATLNAIEKIAPSEDLVIILKQVLETDSNATLRRISTAKLGRVEIKSAAAAAELLSQVLQDKVEAVRRSAANALIRLGGEAVPATANQLEAEEPQTRLLALFVLGKIGKKATAAEEAVQLRLQDENEQVRKLAAEVLRALQLGM